MKKLLTIFILLCSVNVFSGTLDVREISKAWRYGAVNVSTQAATAVTCGQSFPFFGRYKIIIQNLSTNYNVYIGSSTAVTTATGYEIGKSTESIGIIELPLQSGASVYAIGEANPASSTVNIRCLEFK